MVVLLAQPTCSPSAATSCITVRGLSSHRQVSTLHSLEVSLTPAVSFLASIFIPPRLVYIVVL